MSSTKSSWRKCKAQDQSKTESASLSARRWCLWSAPCQCRAKATLLNLRRTTQQMWFWVGRHAASWVSRWTAVCLLRLLEHCRRHRYLSQSGEELALLLSSLLENLLAYRTITHDESPEHRMSCTVNVLVSLQPAPTGRGWRAGYCEALLETVLPAVWC